MDKIQTEEMMILISKIRNRKTDKNRFGNEKWKRELLIF